MNCGTNSIFAEVAISKNRAKSMIYWWAVTDLNCRPKDYETLRYAS